MVRCRPRCQDGTEQARRIAQLAHVSAWCLNSAPKGGEASFDEVAVAGTKLKLVQCSGCKAPAGVVGFEPVVQQIGALERQLTEVLHAIVSSLQVMNSRLDRLDGASK
jgi:hypothetical protein